MSEKLHKFGNLTNLKLLSNFINLFSFKFKYLLLNVTTQNFTYLNLNLKAKGHKKELNIYKTYHKFFFIRLSFLIDS